MNSGTDTRRRVEKRASLSGALLIAVFLTGGELLTVGEASASESYSSGIALLIAVLFVGAATAAARSVFWRRGDGSSLLQRSSVWVFGILAAAAATFAAIESVLEFSRFASDVMIVRAPDWVIGLSFLSFCVFLASRGIKTLKKYALLSAVLIAAGAIALMLFSIPEIDLSLIDADKGTPTVKATVGAFVYKFAPLCVPIVCLSCGCDRDRGGELCISPASAVGGVIVGGAILAVCHLNVTLLLGSALARAEEFPYSVAMSAVSTGKLFMRMEGISYLLYFLAATTRTSVAVGTVLALAKRLLRLRRK